MKYLYDDVSNKISKIITNQYSTSFSFSSRLLGQNIRPAIYSIYGLVRLADEIVDSFHGYEKEAMLAELREEYNKSIQRKISINPVLNSFQKVYHDYNFEPYLVDKFFDSMAMDLKPKDYNKSLYNQYIHGSAEVVGLMCLKVFCDEREYEKLEEYAISLGSAFQKVNFLRDMKSDFEERGRVYFPGVKFDTFSETDKKNIEKDIANDFNNALIGIKMLPKVARSGVYLSYKYYLELLDKIKSKDSSTIKTERVRVSNIKKFMIFVGTYLNPA